MMTLKQKLLMAMFAATVGLSGCAEQKDEDASQASMQEKAEEAVAETSDEAEDMLEDAKEEAEEALDEAKAMAEDAEEKLDKAKEEAAAKAKEACIKLKEQLGQSTEDC